MTLVERLVRCASPSGQESEVARVLIEELEARGFAARFDAAGNVLGTIGQGSTHVYLIGHMDTVPGDIPVCIKKGRLWGRGSVDAKGPLATCVEAASGFADSEQITLTVIGCVGEEADSRGGRHILNSLPTPDLVLVAEPSGWDAITLGYKGSLPVRYTATKGIAHHGAPTSTVAEDAVDFYTTICAATPDRGVGFDEVTIRLTSIQTQPNANHEQARLSLDIRTPPGIDIGAFRQLVRDAAGQAELEIGEYTPAVLRGKRNGLVRALLGGIRAQGGSPVFKRKTGTSDMNLFQVWDVPLVAYGPGDSSLDHTPDEHLDLAEYTLAIKALRQALELLEHESERAALQHLEQGQGGDTAPPTEGRRVRRCTTA